MISAIASLRIFFSMALLIQFAVSIQAQSVTLESAKSEAVSSSSNNKLQTDEHLSSKKKLTQSEVLARRWLQSNDLLVETPYTQERGEVQHTFKFGRTRFENWAFTFEQEWPLWSEKHQLSVTVPGQLGRNEQGARGVGDLTLEYTRQLVGNNESRFTIAPKLGVSLPTGSVRKELGIGAPGVEVSVPVGAMLTQSIGTITNVSASFYGKTANREGESTRLRLIEVGHSFVWYSRVRFNALLETRWERAIAVEDNGHRERRDELFVAPGFRWAHITGNKTVLAPGVSFPLGIGPSRRDRGIMFSFVIEHGFGKPRE